jgi:hypothetical protein
MIIAIEGPVQTIVNDVFSRLKELLSENSRFHFIDTFTDSPAETYELKGILKINYEFENLKMNNVFIINSGAVNMCKLLGAETANKVFNSIFFSNIKTFSIVRDANKIIGEDSDAYESKFKAYRTSASSIMSYINNSAIGNNKRILKYDENSDLITKDILSQAGMHDVITAPMAMHIIKKDKNNYMDEERVLALSGITKEQYDELLSKSSKSDRAIYLFTIGIPKKIISLVTDQHETNVNRAIRDSGLESKASKSTSTANITEVSEEILRVLSTISNKTSKVIYLHSQGIDKKKIAEITNQHITNVNKIFRTKINNPQNAQLIESIIKMKPKPSVLPVGIPMPGMQADVMSAVESIPTKTGKAIYLYNNGVDKKEISKLLSMHETNVNKVIRGNKDKIAVPVEVTTIQDNVNEYDGTVSDEQYNTLMSIKTKKDKVLYLCSINVGKKLIAEIVDMHETNVNKIFRANK